MTICRGTKKNVNALLKSVELEPGVQIQVARFTAARVDPDDRQEYKRGRAMNHMDPETKAIHLRLVDWSIWYRRSLGVLGYPVESYYHKWALLRIAPQPGHEMEIPERAANVDRAISKLGAIDHSVIIRYYCQFRPKRIWVDLGGVGSQSQFDRVLKRARWRVSGFLLAIEQQ